MLTVAVVSLLVGFGPGALLGLSVPAGQHRYVAWAAAPLLTLGLTAVGMAWLPTLGLPHDAMSVLVAEFGLALVIAGAGQWLMHHRRPRAPGDKPGWTVRLRRPRSWRARLVPSADLAALAVAALVTVAIGELVVGRLAYPPGWDAMNHANLVANILASHSTQITDACVTGSTDSAVSCQFYPLAADISWAQIALVSGHNVSSAMMAWSVVVGPLAMVGAVYAAVRLLGGRPSVGAAAVASCAVLGPMWFSLERGRPTETFACGLSVGLALLAFAAIRDRHGLRLGALAGVGGAGLLMTHTYDALFAVTLAGGCLLTRRARRTARAPLATTAVSLTVLVAAIGPLLGALATAGTSRLSVAPAFAGRLDAAIQYWILGARRYALFAFPAPHGAAADYPLAVKIALPVTVVCLAAAPLCLVLEPLRWARGWLLAGALWTLIGVWTSVSTDPLAHRLAALWYGMGVRLTTMIAPVYGVLAVAGAGAIGLVGHAAVRRVRAIRRRRRMQPPTRIAALAAAALAAVLVVAGLVPSSSAPLRADIARFSAVGRPYPRTFAWLAAHTPRGDVVAWDLNDDYLTWAHADAAVGELFGITAPAAESKENFTQRFQAFAWLVNAPGAKPAGCLVERFKIRYVAVGSRHVPGFRDHYRPRLLAPSPRLVLAHRDGPITVYRVTNAASACTTTPAVP